MRSRPPTKRPRRSPPKRPTDAVLAAALICRDEELLLARCLDSLSPVVDAIVVCDTGSRDATVEIAERFGCTVVTHPWSDDFAAARNTALAAARDLGATWVLSVDADETVRVSDITTVRTALASTRADLFAVRLWNYAGPLADPYRKDAPALVPRLLRTAGMQWVGRIHEHPRRIDGRDLHAEEIPGLEFDHWGYCDDFLADKRVRNLAIAQQNVAADPDPVARFELARSLSFSGDRNEARAMFRALLDDDLVTQRRRGVLGWLCSDALKAGDIAAAQGYVELFDVPAQTLAPVRLLRAQVLAASGDHAGALDLIDHFDDFTDGYLLYDNGAARALKMILASRSGRSARAAELMTAASSGAAEPQQVLTALATIANESPAICGRVLSHIDRPLRISLLLALGPVRALPVVDAMWDADLDRVALLAWFRKAADGLTAVQAALWRDREESLLSR